MPRFIVSRSDFMQTEIWKDDIAFMLYHKLSFQASYNTFRTHGVELHRGELIMSQEKMAAELGISTTTLNAKLKKLVALGYISYAGRLHIGTRVKVLNYDEIQPMSKSIKRAVSKAPATPAEKALPSSSPSQTSENPVKGEMAPTPSQTMAAANDSVSPVQKEMAPNDKSNQTQGVSLEPVANNTPQEESTLRNNTSGVQKEPSCSGNPVKQSTNGSSFTKVSLSGLPGTLRSLYDNEDYGLRACQRIAVDIWADSGTILESPEALEVFEAVKKEVQKARNDGAWLSQIHSALVETARK